MLEPLLAPPVGFEEVVQNHFRILRDTIRRQVTSWVDRVTEPEPKARFQALATRLFTALDKLPA